MPPIQTLIVDGNPDYRQDIVDIVHKHIRPEKRNIRQFSSAKSAIDILRSENMRTNLMVIGTNTAENILAVLNSLSADEREKTVIYTTDEEFIQRCKNDGIKAASKKKDIKCLEDEIIDVLSQ